MPHLFNSKVFKIVLANAKRSAKLNRRKVIDLECLLAAIHSSRQIDQVSIALSSVDGLQESLERAIEHLVCTPFSSALISEKMPLDDNVRSVLQPYVDREVDCIGNIVLDGLSRLKSISSKHFDLCEVLRCSASGSECATIFTFASRLACKRSSEAIGLDEVAAACWRAHLSGAFMKRPSLHAHLEAYSDSFALHFERLKFHTFSSVGAEHGSEVGCIKFSEDMRRHTSKTTDAAYELVILATRRVLEHDTKVRAAYHEAGHGVAFALLRPDIRIRQVSVEATETSAGRVSVDFVSNLNPTHGTRDGVFKHAMCLLAGRAAEVRAFGHVGNNSGAGSDIEHATEMMWDAITTYGLDPEIGPLNIRKINKAAMGAAGFLTHRAEQLLQGRMNDVQMAASRLIQENWAAVEAVSKELELRGILSEDQLLDIIRTADALADGVLGLGKAA